MKISNETLAVLKNFAVINNGIVIQKGNVLTTISTGDGVFAKAIVAEKFPRKIAIYDLREFLSTLQLFQSPVLEFPETNYIIIREESGKSAVRYHLTDEQNINHTVDEYEIPSVDFSFKLSNTNLQNILRACSIMELEDIGIYTNDKECQLVAHDSTNTYSNNYTLDVELNESVGKFKHILKKNNLCVLSDDYSVSVCNDGVIEFVSDTKQIKYIIGLEA